MNHKILIITPNLSSLNGIAIHYKGLMQYWNMDIVLFTSFKKKNNISDPIIFLFSIFSFLYKLIRTKPSLIVLNTSLKRGFYSQIFYHLIAKLLRKKTVLFIHGWDINSEHILYTKISQIIFKYLDGVFVLAQIFKYKIKTLYPQLPVFVTTTKVEDSLLDNFDIKQRIGSLNRFLFVSRIEEQKGIFLALKIFRLINNKYPQTTFHIVGDGKAIGKVKEFIHSKNLKNVRLMGRLTGEDLSREYSNADFFFLLSSSEGMPAALLEAMAFGLPIATHPVGGIPDFFMDNKMGILSDSCDENTYFNKIEHLMHDREKVTQISTFNYTYAQTHFMASKVAKKMESFFHTIILGKL